MKLVVKVVSDRTPQVMAGIRTGLGNAAVAIAEDIEAEAKRRIMDGPKTGRTYKRSAKTKTLKSSGRMAQGLVGMGLKGTEKDGKTRFVTGYTFHRASASGEAPANDSSNLAGGINAVKVGSMSAAVTVGAEYGEVLEDELNRPFMGPAFDTVVARAPDIVATEINKQI